MTSLFFPGKEVSIPEIPYKNKISLRASETALIVGDMQNDFVKPGGKLRVPAALETVPGIQRLLQAARKAGVHVAHTQDTMYKNDPEFAIWPPHCVIHSWGWEFVDELKPLPQELVCRKPRYDGFYATELGHFLSNIWRAKNAVIVGTVSNICVLHTAASAYNHMAHVVVPADGVSALSEFGQLVALYQISSLYNGDIVHSVEDIRFE
jgi:nicotinamidase-related amidase